MQEDDSLVVDLTVDEKNGRCLRLTMTHRQTLDKMFNLVRLPFLIDFRHAFVVFLQLVPDIRCDTAEVVETQVVDHVAELTRQREERGDLLHGGKFLMSGNLESQSPRRSTLSRNILLGRRCSLVETRLFWASIQLNMESVATDT